MNRRKFFTRALAAVTGAVAASKGAPKHWAKSPIDTVIEIRITEDGKLVATKWVQGWDVEGVKKKLRW